MHAINVFAVTVAFVLGFFGFSTAGYYPQYYQAFTYQYCIGTPIDFLDTNLNITHEYPGLVIKTTTLKGLWRVVRGVHNINITTVTRSFNIDTRLCSEGKLNDDYPPFNSTEKLASGDLDDSVLTLFQADFKGEKLVVGEEGVSKLDTPFTVKAWALTGTKGFTIFDGEDFQGNATCLDAELTAKNAGYGISVEWTVASNLTINSVRFGCDGNVKNIRTGNSEIMSVSWDGNGEKVEGFEKVEVIPKVIVI